jgi:hypothetical protein
LIDAGLSRHETMYGDVNPPAAKELLHRIPIEDAEVRANLERLEAAAFKPRANPRGA